MDELIDMDSVSVEFEPTMENCQDSLFIAGRPYKASDDDDEEEEEEENSSYRPADSSAQTSGIAPYVEAEAASVAMTTLATELTDEEIRDVQEMGVKLQEFVLDSAEDEELQAIHDEDSSAQLPTELEKRPKASETDVDDIMSDSFTLASAVDCSQNDRSDVKESERHRETSLPLDDDDDDDENDMKELLRFKRQNSRDYLEQAPIDGLLEGIAEEPEEEGTKEIEEEYDSVVIKDEEDESGSVSDAANDTGKETEESEAVDNPSPSVVDVVTSDEAVTATVVDVDGEDDIEVPLDAIQTAEPCDLHEPQNGEFSEDDVVDHTTGVSSQKQETEEGEGLIVSAEPAVEPMDTTTSPSSSGTTSDENAATFDVAKGSDKASADELTVTTSQSKNRNHDYVNIGDLDAPSNDLDAETVRRAAKAEISDEDFCFDETPTKSSERTDASCDYVNVDTIRANKRLVSRMIQEGNDEEFERLEAEIISKLEDEEDSDYCVPKSTPVEAKSGDTELKQFADINGSAATDENENLSLSGHQDLLAADVALADETSNLPDTLKSLDNTRNEEFKEDEQTSEISASVKEFGQWTCEKTSKENGSSEQAVDSDDEIITNYKHHESQKAISIHEQEKMLREEIESCRDDLSLKESFGLQHVKKSNLKSDHSRLASPAYETSSGVRTNDILPEAGSVKALVAQWQQMESKRWSRKDDMKVQNGGEQAESRGMNRSRSCGPLPRKIRVLSPDGVLDDEGRRINDWTVVGGGGEGGDLQEQYNSQPSLTRAMLVKFERLDYETSTSAKQAPPPTKKTFKWEVKEMKTLNRPGFLAH